MRVCIVVYSKRKEIRRKEKKRKAKRRKEKIKIAF